MKAHVRFALYLTMTSLLIISFVHYTAWVKFLTCLTFASIALQEYADRALTQETLSRLGLEIRDGKLYHEHSTRRIELFDIVAMKKAK